ncbi:FAD-binding protein [Oceaniovalibus sp. ACAM 378]|uniref:FAD-binding protein n=1 Tax=Oceaniovalibus sp. ACAM 378 TaxID=2599923 RepID=UPI0011D3BFEB|nr:FAD-binding protein [Oceaniovalibus sp. ACAM 378]TYB90748.1 FAD-binding protein [Oceaniovalibus sp. ACAM 378]
MLLPKDEAELGAIVREADGPLWIEGGGTRGPVAARDGVRLGTSGLTGITLYEPGALTLVARAGTPLAEVEAALAAENQRLPFEPMDHRALLGTDGVPTIGGVVAGNVSGPRRIQAGACRDSLIGVRFVDGRGDAIKNGGRVMKNVTGYDLVKLLAGSHGTLGVLTEVSFKVLPVTPEQAVVILPGLSVGQAIAAMAAALSSPFEVSGAAHRPGGDVMLRIEGFAASVSYRAGRLVKLLAGFGPAEILREGVAAMWRDIGNGAQFSGTGQDVWRISVKPADGTAVAARLEGADLLFDWGGGLIWAGVAPGQDARAALDGIAGHATLVRATPETHARLGTFHPEPAPLAAIAAGLRAQFDPRGILNPGRMA